LLIDRNDQVINLCEIKFYNQEIQLTAAMAESILNKQNVFQMMTKTKKQIFITLISTFGMHPNKHSIGLVDNSITMDDLF
jgi:hypothetical protein